MTHAPCSCLPSPPAIQRCVFAVITFRLNGLGCVWDSVLRRSKFRKVSKIPSYRRSTHFTLRRYTLLASVSLGLLGLYMICHIATVAHPRAGSNKDPHLQGLGVLGVRHAQGSNWTGTHRNGVPVLFFKTGTAFRFIFFLNSERKSDSCCCVHTTVLPSVAVLKLRLGIEIAINDTSACLLICYILGHFIPH